MAAKELKNGRTPTGPGLGVELKDAVLRKYAYQGTKGLDKLTLPMERF